MVEHLEEVAVSVLVTPNPTEVVQQAREVTVTVLDKVSVKEPVKPLVPVSEREQIVSTVIMEELENYMETTETFTMVLVAWEVQKQDLKRKALEEVILEVAEVVEVPSTRQEMEEEFQKVGEKVLDHQEVLDLATTKDLVKVWEMPSLVVMVTPRWLVVSEVVEV